MNIKTCFLGVAVGLFAASTWAADGTTSVSAGIDVASGDYGTATTSRTVSLPVSIRHDTGPWMLRASIPFVWTEGTFSRERGFDDSGLDDGATGNPRGKRTQSGLGDLTLSAFHNVIASKSGFIVDVGAKAKLATADQAKTLITTGENDYSAQLDLVQAIGRASLFASLGVTRKGDTALVDYRDPFYGSLGGSFNMGEPGSLGVAWDYREKSTATGSAVSEVTAFYSLKISPAHKVQVYLINGLSDGSPNSGGGLVLTQRF